MKKNFVLFLLLASPLSAAPSISSVNGTIATGQTGNVNGSSFGGNWGRPYLFADFASSLNPDGTKGQASAWTATQSMTWTATGGYAGGGAMAADDTGVWTMEIDDDSGWTNTGQKTYTYMRAKQNFIITPNSNMNWKKWRMWAPGFTFPDVYYAENNGINFVEDITGSGYYSDFNPNTTNWIVEERLLQASSLGVKDGSFLYRINGQDKASGSLMTRNSVRPALMTMHFPCHAVQANKSSWSPGWSTSNRIWWDDVYVSTNWARVMIGNASTLASCTDLTIQIPRAGGSSNVPIYWNTVGYSNGDDAWVYVFDENNLANSSGFHITIGTGGGTTPPPTAVPPVSLAFSTTSPTSVTATWSAGSPAGDTYRLEASVTSGFTSVTSSTTAGLSATVPGLLPNTTYFARALSTLSGVDSAYTSSITTATLANVPLTPTFVSVGLTSATITWGVNSNPSGTQFVAQSATATVFSTIQTVNTTGNTATFTGFPQGITVYTRVYAINRGGNRTAYSGVASATTGNNTAPTANGQSVTTNEDTAKSITLSGSDPEGSPLSYLIVTQPTHGLLNGIVANMTYTPFLNFNGSDSFQFKVSDGLLFSSPATVSITVNPVNDPPVANNQSISLQQDTPTSITLTASDVDGDTLTYSTTSAPSSGTLSGSAPNLTYTPNSGYTGSDSFLFVANDGQANSNSGTISLTVTADIPPPPPPTLSANPACPCSN